MEILAECDGLDRDGKGALDGLATRPGRRPLDPSERDNIRLRQRVTRLESELGTARRVIEVQRKLSTLLEELATDSADPVARATRSDRPRYWELVPMIGVTAACAAASHPRATHYRWHRKSPLPAKPERMPIPQPGANDDVEREKILRVLLEPEHVDESPATVYTELLGKGIYMGSTSTMHWILHAGGEVSERRRQATHPVRVKPKLVAVLDAAYQAHPERFVRKRPTPPPLPHTAWIATPRRKPRPNETTNRLSQKV